MAKKQKKNDEEAEKALAEETEACEPATKKQKKSDDGAVTKSPPVELPPAQPPAPSPTTPAP